MAITLGREPKRREWRGDLGEIGCDIWLNAPEVERGKSCDCTCGTPRDEGLLDVTGSVLRRINAGGSSVEPPPIEVLSRGSAVSACAPIAGSRVTCI